MPPGLSPPTRDVGSVSLVFGCVWRRVWVGLGTGRNKRGDPSFGRPARCVNGVISTIMRYHSHCSPLPRWPGGVFTGRFEHFCTATFPADTSGLEVRFYGRFDPVMSAAPPSRTRASRRLISTPVSIPFGICHLPRWQERVRDQLSKAFRSRSCRYHSLATTTTARESWGAFSALHCDIVAFLTSQGCTAVSIGTRTALARFTGRFHRDACERV